MPKAPWPYRVQGNELMLADSYRVTHAHTQPPMYHGRPLGRYLSRPMP